MKPPYRIQPQGTPGESDETFFHPDNPAAIRPAGGSPIVASSHGSGRMALGLISGLLALFIAVAAPFLGVLFIPATLLALPLAIIAILSGRNVRAEMRVAGWPTAAQDLPHLCLRLGWLMLAVNLLSAAAWVTVILGGVQPILW